MATTVSTNPNLSRYEIHVDGELAGFSEFADRDGTTTFTHTEVDSRFAGQGLASTLIRSALDDARTRGSSVVPQCDFVAAFIGKHPEYADLLA